MISRKRIFEIIQIGKESDFYSRLFDYVLAFLIMLNLFTSIYSTFDFSAAHTHLVNWIDRITSVIFTIEYLLRLWTADYLYPKLKSKFQAKVRYIFSLSGLIEFFAFAPFYLPGIFPGGMVTFRIFRIMRILKLFRITPYYDAFNVISEVFIRKKRQLIFSVMLILILMISGSLLMYGIEHEVQPKVFRNAFTGFWWASSTIFTVGYGDIYPVTTLGRVIGIVMTFLGVGLVAVPTGILSAGFMEQVQRIDSANKDKFKCCPYCGKKL